jgi:hypothetical protein
MAMPFFISGIIINKPGKYAKEKGIKKSFEDYFKTEWSFIEYNKTCRRSNPCCQQGD